MRASRCHHQLGETQQQIVQEGRMPLQSLRSSVQSAECHGTANNKTCVTSEPCSNSVLTGVSRFTWDTMQGCCRGDDEIAHHDSASVWYLDGADGPIEPAIANPSQVTAEAAVFTAVKKNKTRRRVDRGIYFYEDDDEEEINCRGMSTALVSDILATCEASKSSSQRLCLCCAEAP